MRVLGIDPGGRNVGMVVREGDALLGHCLVRREDGMKRFLERVVGTARRLTVLHRAELVAVEDLNDPTPQMGTTSVRGLLDTAHVLGALLSWVSHDEFSPDEVQLIRPAKFGTAGQGWGREGLLAAYPRQLVGDREVKGTGKRRHLRSAWDCAGAARPPRLCSSPKG